MKEDYNGMRDIQKCIRLTDAYIRIRHDRIDISSKACELIGITHPYKHIRITEDEEDVRMGRMNRLYISLSPVRSGLMAKMRNGRHTAYVDCRSLCTMMASRLEGYGTYRVCEEVTRKEGDRVFYEIFFKKYEED